MTQSADNHAALQELRRKIENAPLDDQRAFQQVILDMRDELGYSPLELARKFNCSVPTIDRYCRGVAAPFVKMRRIIFEQLVREINERLAAI